MATKPVAGISSSLPEILFLIKIEKLIARPL